MKRTTKRNLYRFLAFLIVGGIVILLYIAATSFIENKIESKLASLHGRASSVSVSLLSRSLFIHDLELYPQDGVPYGFRLKKLTVQGIDLYQLLSENKLVVGNIKADSGRIMYDQSLKKGIGKSVDPDVQHMHAQNISLTNILGEVRTDTIVDFSGVLNFHATGVTLKIDSGKLPVCSLHAFDGSIQKINISRQTGMYGVSIAGFRFSSSDQTMIIDSLLVIPNYSKFDFAHKKGEQVARISVAIPRIMMEKVALEKMVDSVFTASKLEITSFDLHAFKDKRVPFLRDYNIPLPMVSFAKLPFSITIDSLVIKDSRVTIEEISEQGTESGKVTFEHIQATAPRFSNRYKKGDPVNTVLHATGLIMGTGEINAHFTLPLDGSPVYTTKGFIKNLPIENLNPALENLVRFRIESGQLNNLKFEFQYTDLQSTGTMEIDYENLRLTGLKKKKDEASDIKTLLANAVVKNDKTRTLPKLQRTGKINIERDRKRYIFNVWWRSILDGLRSTVLGIDNGKRDKNKSKSKK